MSGAARATLTIREDTLCVEGIVDFKTVVSLCEQGSEWLIKKAPTHAKVDLSRVTDCNSSATTLLLSWVRVAQQQKKSITVSGVSAQLRSLMDLGGIQHLKMIGGLQGEEIPVPAQF